MKFFNQNNKDNTYMVKNFAFTILEGIKIEEADNADFEIVGENYSALITIYKNPHENISKIKDSYGGLMQLNDIKFEGPTMTSIEDIDILSYNMLETKYVFCYMDAPNSFIYEIKLKNDDDSFKIDNLAIIVKFLKGAKYNEDDNKEYKYSNVGDDLLIGIRNKILQNQSNNQE